MNKQYFCYGLCAALALRGVVIPSWEITVALVFAIVLSGFWMWLDFKTADVKKDSAVDGLKEEIKTVSDRLSSLSLKIGLKTK